MVTTSEHPPFAVMASTSAVAFILVALSMALRMYTRIVVLKRTGWEDWILCAAFLILLASLAMFPKAKSLGLLKPATEVPHENLVALGKISYANECLNAPAMAFIKLSIFLQMIRIFIPIHQTKSFYFLVTFAALNTMWFVGRFFITAFQCTPVSRTWDRTVDGHCLDYATTTFVSGGVNMATDCIMLALPIFWISRLKMDMKRKLTAGVVFVVGLLACTASTVRFVFSHELFRAGSSNPDVSALITVALCTEGELAAGIITANLPALPAFIKHFKAESRDSRRVCSGELPDSDRLRREFDPSNLGAAFAGKAALDEEGSRTPSTRHSDEKEIGLVNSTDFSTLPELDLRTA